MNKLQSLRWRLLLWWLNRKHDIRFRIGQRRKPLPKKMSGGYAYCPHCNEPLYTKTVCIACGQRINWDG